MFLGVLLVLVIVLLLVFGAYFLRGAMNNPVPGTGNSISGEINLPNIPVPTIPTGVNPTPGATE